MPAKQRIFYFHAVPSRSFLDDAIAPLVLRGLLTKTQHSVIVSRATAHLPAPVTIEQRMAKGSTYVSVGDHYFVLNNRAKVLTSAR